MWSKAAQQKPQHADAAQLKQRLDRNRPTYSNKTDVALPDQKLCGHGGSLRYPKLGWLGKPSLKRLGPHACGTQDTHKSMDLCSMAAVAEILNDEPDGSMHVLSDSCASCIRHICEVGRPRSGLTPSLSPHSPLAVVLTPHPHHHANASSMLMLTRSCRSHSRAPAAHPHPEP